MEKGAVYIAPKMNQVEENEPYPPRSRSVGLDLSPLEIKRAVFVVTGGKNSAEEGDENDENDGQLHNDFAPCN